MFQSNTKRGNAFVQLLLIVQVHAEKPTEEGKEEGKQSPSWP